MIICRSMKGPFFKESNAFVIISSMVVYLSSQLQTQLLFNEIFDAFSYSRVFQWTFSQARVSPCITEGDHWLLKIVLCSIEQRWPLATVQHVWVCTGLQEHRHCLRVREGSIMQGGILRTSSCVDIGAGFDQRSHNWGRALELGSEVQSGHLWSENGGNQNYWVKILFHSIWLSIPPLMWNICKCDQGVIGWAPASFSGFAPPCRWWGGGGGAGSRGRCSHHAWYQAAVRQGASHLEHPFCSFCCLELNCVQLLLRQLWKPLSLNYRCYRGRGAIQLWTDIIPSCRRHFSMCSDLFCCEVESTFSSICSIPRLEQASTLDTVQWTRSLWRG